MNIINICHKSFFEWNKIFDDTKNMTMKSIKTFLSFCSFEIYQLINELINE